MENIQDMPDIEVVKRYCKESFKLKMIFWSKKHEGQHLGYPDTLAMNVCRRELERRGLPLPLFHLSATQPPQEEKSQAISEQKYMTEVMRTYAGSDTSIDKLTLSALGLAGESGEVADTIKKVLYQGHHLEVMLLVEELGDVLWYLMLACNALDCTLADVMNVNIAKLRDRYPDGFDSQRSINR